LRDSLDGPQWHDQGLTIDDRPNFVPANQNSIAFGRTPPQGFFPNGTNGRLTAS
jgi:hypothetical protein